MITFKQVGDGTPKAIEVTTDDEGAELIRMSDAFEAMDENEGIEYVAGLNLAAAKMEDGQCTFTIPGDEAGEVADMLEMEDMPELAQFLDELRARERAGQ